jgi:hypothetical protein
MGKVNEPKKGSLEIFLEDSKRIIDTQRGPRLIRRSTRRTNVFDLVFYLDGKPYCGSVVTILDGSEGRRPQRVIDSSTHHAIYEQVIKRLCTRGYSLVLKIIGTDEAELQKSLKRPITNFVSHRDEWDQHELITDTQGIESIPDYGGHYVCFESKKGFIKNLLDSYWSRRVTWMDSRCFAGAVIKKDKLEVVPKWLGINDPLKKHSFILNHSLLEFENFDFGQGFRIHTRHLGLEELKTALKMDDLNRRVRRLRPFRGEAVSEKPVKLEISRKGRVLRKIYS